MSLCELIKEQKWEELMTKLNAANDDEERRETAEQICNNGKTLLSLACEMGATVAVVEALINASPAPLQRRDEGTGYLPLHVACLKAMSEDAIGSLISHYPEAREVAGYDGYTPLHCLMFGHKEQPPSASLVRKVMKRGAITAHGADGFPPLHLAILMRRYWAKRDKANNEESLCSTIYVLLTENKCLREQTDDFDRTPIHLALDKEMGDPLSLRTIKLLASPKAISMKDAMGNTPFFYVYDANRNNPNQELLLCEQDVTREVMMFLLPSSSFQQKLGDTKEALNVESAMTALLKIVQSRADKLTKRQVQNPQKIDEFKTLEVFLNAKPSIIPDGFFRDLNNLPGPFVLQIIDLTGTRAILSREIAKPAVASFIVVDVMSRVCLTIAFTRVTVFGAESNWLNVGSSNGNVPTLLATIYYCAVYILSREVIQFKNIRVRNGSNQSCDLKKRCKAYFYDRWNWVDLTGVIMAVVSTILMAQGTSGGSYVIYMISGALVWFMLIVILKSITTEYAVFVEALLQIIWVLLPFLLTSFLVLGAFAFMYYVDAVNNGTCNMQSTETRYLFMYYVDAVNNGTCNMQSTETRYLWDETRKMSFCTFPEALLAVYSMFVGGGPESEHLLCATSTTIISILFGLVAVLLLLNVVIAVVTARWDQVNEKAQSVFWLNKLQFLIEVRGFLPSIVNCSHQDGSLLYILLSIGTALVLFPVVVLYKIFDFMNEIKKCNQADNDKPATKDEQDETVVLGIHHGESESELEEGK